MTEQQTYVLIAALVILAAGAVALFLLRRSSCRRRAELLAEHKAELQRRAHERGWIERDYRWRHAKGFPYMDEHLGKNH